MSVEFEEKVLSKLDLIDQKFDAMDQRFDVLEQRFDAHEAKDDEHYDDTMQTLRSFDVKFRDITEKIDALDGRVQNVESIVSTRWNIPEMSARLDAVELEVRKHTGRLNLLESAKTVAVN